MCSSPRGPPVQIRVDAEVPRRRGQGCTQMLSLMGGGRVGGAHWGGGPCPGLSPRPPQCPRDYLTAGSACQSKLRAAWVESRRLILDLETPCQQLQPPARGEPWTRPSRSALSAAGTTGAGATVPLHMAFPSLPFSSLPLDSSVLGTSLVVQWLKLGASTVGGWGSIPGQGTRSHTLQLKIS